MLQFRGFYEDCYKTIGKTPSANALSGHDLPNLSFVSQYIRETDLARREIIDQDSFWSKTAHALDASLWTNEQEYIDAPDFPLNQKMKIINGLHFKNHVFGTYNKLIKIILPHLEFISQTMNRPARILEIASGMGYMAIALAEKLKSKHINAQVTGSDIVPEYVLYAKNNALKKQVSVQFETIDALKLDALETHKYDLIVSLHSLHHFTPEQIVALITGANQVATVGLVAVDAFRGLRNLVFIGGTSLVPTVLSANGMYFHDAWLSARKMYPEKMLEIFARQTCPSCRVDCRQISMGLTALQVFSEQYTVSTSSRGMGS